MWSLEDAEDNMLDFGEGKQARGGGTNSWIWFVSTPRLEVAVSARKDILKDPVRRACMGSTDSDKWSLGKEDV